MAGQEQHSSKTLLVQEEVTNNIGAVSLLGRKVEEIIFFNAQEIRVDSIISSLSFDLSNYKSVQFVAINTMDVAVPLFLQCANTSVRYWYGTNFVSNADNKITVPIGASSNRFILNGKSPETLDFAYYEPVRFTVDCVTAPTSGSFTLKAWGVPN